jgi:hypothetical protein
MLQEALILEFRGHHRPTAQQREWLRRGLGQPGGKLPLFDAWGQRINERTVRSCIDQGWAEPWFTNPLKPDWLVCKLTDAGRSAIDDAAGTAAPNTARRATRA